MATRIIIERPSLSTSNGGTPSGVTDGELNDFDIPHQSLSATAFIEERRCLSLTAMLPHLIFSYRHAAGMFVAETPRRSLFKALVLKILFHMVQGVFFQPGDLRLRNTNLFCDLHLCFPLKKAKGQDMAFALRQPLHRFF